MAAKITLSPPEPIKAMFAFEQNAYSNSIIVIRSFVLKNDQILLVEERSDGFWTLPGGFADVNESPSEAVVREIFEESGFFGKTTSSFGFVGRLKT